MALYGHGGLEYRIQYNYQIDIFMTVYIKAPQDILILNQINSTRLNYIHMNMIRQFIHQNTKKILLEEVTNLVTEYRELITAINN